MAAKSTNMGKIRAKKRVSRSRAEPAGLPTTDELNAAAAEETPPSLSQPILQRVSEGTMPYLI